MIVVLDTNVLVSGLMSPGNPPGKIIDLLRAGEITLAIDDRIFDEYSAVLGREYFRKYFNDAEKDLILDFIAHDSVRVLCTQTVKGLPDQDDTCFLEVALASKAPLFPNPSSTLLHPFGLGSHLSGLTALASRQAVPPFQG